jgi:ornithine cyclodeaminase/alanine dehydrogenase-like protein (mu-crystallin family)
MRILNKKTIEDLTEAHAVTDIAEQAIKGQPRKTYVVPDRQYTTHGDITYLYSPVFGPEMGGLKTIAVRKGGRSAANHTISGTMQLFDTNTHQLLALLDGATLTGITTGAAGAVGVRHLAPTGAKRLGMVGAGVQGFYQAIAADAERAFQQIMVFDRDMWKTEQAVEKIKQHTYCKNVIPASTIEELLTDSEVIITATNSSVPVLPEDKPILYGKTYIATGSCSPGMRELPITLFERNLL